MGFLFCLPDNQNCPLSTKYETAALQLRFELAKNAMKNWNHLSVFLEGMENVDRKIHPKQLRINDKSHNSVVLDDLNLR